MDLETIDILDEIVEEFAKLDIVKEYKKLNELVSLKYAKDIFYFNDAKVKYNEMLKYKIDSKATKDNLIRLKEKLYSYDEVKRLKELEYEIDNMLKKMSNDISLTVSNKFKLKKVFEV